MTDYGNKQGFKTCDTCRWLWSFEFCVPGSRNSPVLTDVSSALEWGPRWTQVPPLSLPALGSTPSQWPMDSNCLDPCTTAQGLSSRTHGLLQWPSHTGLVSMWLNCCFQLPSQWRVNLVSVTVPGFWSSLLYLPWQILKHELVTSTHTTSHCNCCNNTGVLLNFLLCFNETNFKTNSSEN
jgi:hypothetical protein